MVAAGRNPFLLDSLDQYDEFFAMTMAKPPFVPWIVKRMLAAEQLARRDQLAEIQGDFGAEPRLDDRLAQITIPAWVAWGRRDELIHVSSAEVWAHGLPDATLTIYEDLGHLPMLEDAGRVLRDYRAFLDRVERTRSSPRGDRG
jgi:pimeloyl-ACP methyl ester carboxylesterase